MASINFKGKNAVWNHHLSVPYHTLEKDKKNSLEGKNDTENLIIEGDNLLALKALLPKYQGRVKCIYIDPPYNTGNEGWVYNDKVNNPVIKNWIGEVVGKEGEDLVRHDKWLCMMAPRLKLLKELLTEDGVIFISIDEHESCFLRAVCDEIFGESNFVGQITSINNLKGRNDKKNLSTINDFVFIYQRSPLFEAYGLPLTEEQIAEYKFTDEKGEKYKLRDLRKRGRPDRREDRPNMYFPVFYNQTTKKLSLTRSNPDEIEITPKRGDGSDGRWRWGKERVGSNLDILHAKHNKKKNTWGIEHRVYLKSATNEELPGSDDLDEDEEQADETRSKVKTVWMGGEFSTDVGRREIKNLFGFDPGFDYPKPVELVKRCIQLATKNDDIVLDSFAGSGTTAQAVFEQNVTDGGKRMCILVQLPEQIGSESQAFKEGYKWIHEITRDRVKKVIERDKLDVGFTYYTLGPDIDGKKILAGKNMPTWDVMAKYVHFLATGKPIDEVTVAKKTWEITATKKGTGVYLIYADTLEELKKLAITRDWLEAVKDKAGKKIVYAPACFLDKEILDEYNISFVQVPFNLFTRK